MFLAHDIVESQRAPFAGKNEIAHDNFGLRIGDCGLKMPTDFINPLDGELKILTDAIILPCCFY
jgi:hypothetical protein